MKHSNNPVVLLVDDEPEVREFLSLQLRQAGYRVLEAGNGKDALEIAADPGVPIDLLITDVLMPHMHGIELVKRARSLRPGLPAVFISGHSEQILGTLTLVPEKAPFLKKPINPKALFALLQPLLGTPHWAAGPYGNGS